MGLSYNLVVHEEVYNPTKLHYCSDAHAELIVQVLHYQAFCDNTLVLHSLPANSTKITII